MSWRDAEARIYQTQQIVGSRAGDFCEEARRRTAILRLLQSAERNLRGGPLEI